MHKEIQRKSDELQEMLWSIAEGKRWISRTTEQADKLKAIWDSTILNEARKHSMAMPEPDKKQLKVSDASPIEKLLALAFMNTSLAEYAAAQGNEDALDLLIVAAESTGIIRAISMLPMAQKPAASILANLRHAENRKLKQYAIQYWRENIDPSLSASKAADQLIRVVNLSHKKLAEIIAAERKKMT